MGMLGEAQRSPRVVLLLNNLHGGGAEKMALRWLDELSRLGISVRLAVLEEPTPTERERVGSGNDVECIVIGRRQALRAVWRLWRLLSPARTDVVLAMQMPANLAALCFASARWGRRPRVVISERNIVSVGLADSGPRHRRKVRAARLLYRRADRMIALSHPVAAEMVGGFAVQPSRCVVVPNPVLVRPPAPRRWRDADAGTLDVLVVGRLVDSKRPLLALEVARSLSRRGYEVVLHFVGTGPLEEHLRAAADGAGAATAAGPQVRLHGWVSDWISVVEGPAVLLHPSAKEGFGNVLVEAAAAGIPAVAFSGALGVADAVVPGVTGDLAPRDDPETFADAVERCRDMDTTAARQWLERFTVPRSTAMVRAVIEEVAS